jgi:hypothetical protein
MGVMPSIESCKALLELDAAGALVPHGIGGHARNCLTWAVDEIGRLQAALDVARTALLKIERQSEESRAILTRVHEQLTTKGD